MDPDLYNKSRIRIRKERDKSVPYPGQIGTVCHDKKLILVLKFSVADPKRFDSDPDPAKQMIRIRIRIKIRKS